MCLCLILKPYGATEIGTATPINIRQSIDNLINDFTEAIITY